MHEYKATILNVVDGDTIDVIVDLGFKIFTRQRVRLSRVNTPERAQENFLDAKKFVQDMLLGKEVLIKSYKTSKWGYFLVDVLINNVDVSDALILAGYGKPYNGGSK